MSDFRRIFIEGGYWQYYSGGIRTTLVLTFFATLMGVVLGVVVALIRSSWDRVSPTMRFGVKKILFWTVDAVCKIYLTVIRGTPVVVQLMIIYFVYVKSSSLQITAGILAFGINSGAYVAEIMRAGIMSIDHGQLEAGRSLGLNYTQTMRYVILPQAFRNILPALCNEFIVLLKETSVVGYIGVMDLMRGAYITLGLTYTATVPLYTAALIYLAMVMLFTWLVGILERRLRSREH